MLHEPSRLRVVEPKYFTHCVSVGKKSFTSQVFKMHLLYVWHVLVLLVVPQYTVQYSATHDVLQNTMMRIQCIVVCCPVKKVMCIVVH